MSISNGKATRKGFNVDNLHSAFWMRDIKPTTDTDDLINLASYRRAIQQFIRIKTGKNVPVKFHKKNDSYTTGKSVTISSKIKNEEFDAAVGLALHEARHITKTDFKVIKRIKRIVDPRIVQKATQKLELKPKKILARIKKIHNWIEDRRNDYFDYQESPGYQPYYDATYDKYFYTKRIGKALRSDKFRNETYTAYKFRLFNLLHEDTDINALKGLPEIVDLLDLDNIDRFGEEKSGTAKALDLAIKIWEVMIKYLVVPPKPEKTNKPQEEQSQQGDDSNDDDFDPEDIDDDYDEDYDENVKREIEYVPEPEDDDDDEEDEDDGEEDGEPAPDDDEDEIEAEGPSQNKDEDESDDNDSDGDENEDKNKNEDDSTEEENKDDDSDGDDPLDDERPKDEEDENPEGEDELTDEEIDDLINDIKKQDDFVDGNPEKEEMPDDVESQLDDIEESGTTFEEVGKAFYGKVRCLVIRKLNKGILNTLPLGSMRIHSESSEGVDKGITLGRQLVAKLRVRNEINEDIIPRKKRGKISGRLLSGAGYGYESIFRQIEIDEYGSSLIHISVDASYSMHGDKWKKALQTCVAIAKAADSIENLDVVISFRTTKRAPEGGDYPLMIIAYDSRVDPFNKILSLFPYMKPDNMTPEGLAFEAVMEDILSSMKGRTGYFVNFSDGEPYITNVAGMYQGYQGYSATEQTKGEVKKMRNNNIKILSFYIGSHSYNLDAFKAMYGKDAAFIDVEKIVPLAGKINKLFIDESH